MTTKRRSLNAALDMSAEHSAFIRGGLPAETQVQSPKQPPQEAPILLRTEVAKPKVQYEVVEANEPDEPINWSEREEGTKTAVTTTKRNRPRTTRREQSTNDEVMLGMANLFGSTHDTLVAFDGSGIETCGSGAKTIRKTAKYCPGNRRRCNQKVAERAGVSLGRPPNTRQKRISSRSWSTIVSDSQIDANSCMIVALE